MSDRVTLAIDGQLYGGWTEVQIDQSLEMLCGAFTLGLTTRWVDQPERMEIKAGSAVKLAIGDETLITGWIDSFDPEFDHNAFHATVTGRDRAADLIDCSAVHTPGSWRNAALMAILADLARPFGITVTAEVDTGPPIKRFAIQQGESVFEAMERLLRYRALLSISDADGNIRIMKPSTGAATARLVLGENLLGGRATHNAADRFSQVIVKGQASGDDNANGKAVSAVKAEAKDGAVKRHRPLIVIGEEQSDIATLTKRAAWEVTTRAARAQSAELIVQGWRDGDGKLWSRNRMARVEAAELQIMDDLLITGVRFSKGEDGTITTLTVARPEAYSLQPISEKAALSELEGAR